MIVIVGENPNSNKKKVNFMGNLFKVNNEKSKLFYEVIIYS